MIGGTWLAATLGRDAYRTVAAAGTQGSPSVQQLAVAIESVYVKLDQVIDQNIVLFNQNRELARTLCAGQAEAQWKRGRIPCKTLLTDDAGTWQSNPAVR